MTLTALTHRITSTCMLTLVLVTLVVAGNSALGSTLSQNTSGISHYVYGEESFMMLTNQIGFSTSGGPTGPAAANLSVQLDAPDGQVFRFDDSAYPGSTFSLVFRPLVSGDMTGITPSSPIFELVNPTGTVAVTESQPANAANFGNSLYINSYQVVSGTGTFSGIRLTSQLTGASGQTLTWGGGDGEISGEVGGDAGPVLTSVAVVPEPGTLLLLATAAVGAISFVRRQPPAERR